MKVVARVKRKKLASNEVRFLIINHNALGELLWENLMEHQNDYFHIGSNCDDALCEMNWDQERGILTYAVVPLELCRSGNKLNYNYLYQKYGITTKSVFRPGCYKTIPVTQEMLMPLKSKKQGE